MREQHALRPRGEEPTPIALREGLEQAEFGQRVGGGRAAAYLSTR